MFQIKYSPHAQLKIHPHVDLRLQLTTFSHAIVRRRPHPLGEGKGSCTPTIKLQTKARWEVGQPRYTKKAELAPCIHCVVGYVLLPFPCSLAFVACASALTTSTQQVYSSPSSSPCCQWSFSLQMLFCLCDLLLTQKHHEKQSFVSLLCI